MLDSPLVVKKIGWDLSEKTPFVIVFFNSAVFMMKLLHAFNNTKVFDYMH